MKTYFLATIRLGWVLAIIFLMACHVWSATPADKPVENQPSAATLVRLALDHELAGRNDQREAALRQALQQSPDDASVRWQLGQVRIGDRWLTPGQVEKASREDPRVEEYRRRREAAGLNVADQVALAQWCRKNKLADEERIHWLLTLQLQPGQPDAVQGLGLRKYQKMWLTNEQIALLREQKKKVLQAMDHWRSLVGQWRRAVESHQSPPAALPEKVAQISDPVEMQGLERAINREIGPQKTNRTFFHEWMRQWTEAIERNPHPVAAQLLAHIAVFSEFEDLRRSAAAELKKRPLDHSVPLLLSGLQSPIEGDAQFMMCADGQLLSQYTLYQEGALADVSYSHMVSPMERNSPPIKDKIGERASRPVFAAGRLLNARDSQAQAARSSADFNSNVQNANLQIEQRNARIFEVLKQITGLDLGEKPKDWWKWWWEDYNELYTVGGPKGVSPGGSSAKPTIQIRDSEKYSYGPAIEREKTAYAAAESARRQAYAAALEATAPIRQAAADAARREYEALHPRPPSHCFAPGTKVWTLTGKRPIEEVRIGDRVLAQEVESGELAYKPVLAVTALPSGPQLKIGLGSESISTTLAHPFWVLGDGWQMSKQLETGAKFHGLSGGVPVENVEKDESAQAQSQYAYNLIVAEFNTYFVGEHGILVHDNTPRRPTSALLPGLLPKTPPGGTLAGK
jgi:hypothetical protein